MSTYVLSERSPFSPIQLLSEFKESAELHKPIIFTSTMRTGYPGHKTLEIGTGRLDPQRMAITLVEYAFEQGIEPAVLFDSFREFLLRWAANRTFWHDIAGYMAGSLNRNVKVTSLAPLPMEFLTNKIAEQDPNMEHKIFSFVLADYAATLLAPLGMVQPGQTYKFVTDRPISVVNYRDLESATIGSYFVDVFSTMLDTDVTLLKNMVATKQTINPLQLSTVIGSGITHAVMRLPDYGTLSTDLAQMMAILTKLYRNDADELSDRVRNHPFITRAYQNVAWISIITSHYYSHHADVPTLLSSSEHLLEVVIPRLERIFTSTDWIQIVPIADAVSHMGHRRILDSEKNPASVLLYSAATVESKVRAFVPIKLQTAFDAVLLDEDIAAGSRLTSLLSAAISIADPVKSVERKAAVLQSLYGYSQQRATATTFHQGLPADVSPEEAYFLMLEYVIALNATTSILVFHEKGDPGTTPLPLVRLTTHAIDGFNPGSSVAFGGILDSYEPEEIIALLPSRDPSRNLVRADIEDDVFDNLHIWDFGIASNSLMMKAEYETSVRNRKYTLRLDAMSLLATPYERKRLRMLKLPLLGQAIVDRLNGYIEDIDHLEQIVETHPEGSIERVTLQAMISRIHNDMVQHLMSVAATPLGTSVTRSLLAALRAELRGTKFIDDFADLTRGAAWIDMNLFVAIMILQFLDLVSEELVHNVLVTIRDSGIVHVLAASHTVGATGGERAGFGLTIE